MKILRLFTVVLVNGITMRLGLFSHNDKVLLVGEGNFSFSVCLCKHELPIKITASCLEKEPQFKKQQENIDYLYSKKVPVLFNVDATKLHEDSRIHQKHFSKVIFNFPHIGGKMKIHLNRQLLRNFFVSSSLVIGEGGEVLVTLCRGQGGTPADRPQRKWADSWQITEMAAHGNFVLTKVEPFRAENFEQYECIGYRSQEVKFHMEGALVHVFVKRKPIFACFGENQAQLRLSLVPLAENLTELVPFIYSELYQSNPLLNLGSPINFLKDLLVNFLKEIAPESVLKILTDDEIPIFVENQIGVPCVSKMGDTRFLRQDGVQTFSAVLSLLNFTLKNEIIIFPGTYFNPKLGKDFSKKAPIEIKFLMWGEKLLRKILNYIRRVTEIFRSKDLLSFSRQSKVSNQYYNENIYSVTSCTEILCKNEQTNSSLVAATVHHLRFFGEDVEAAIINADFICNYFFQMDSWKEIWTKETLMEIGNCGKPNLIRPLIYPSTYKFDITLKFQTKDKFLEGKMYEILWCAAGLIIEEVELVNVYVSDKDWSSRCYRITYKSLDTPLFRNRVLDIHCKVVGRMLEMGLNPISMTLNILRKFNLGTFKLASGIIHSCRVQVVAFSSTNDFQPVALIPRKAKAKDSASQFFIDNCRVETVGGKGGDGCISFLKLWSNEKAGPDGGDGGNGGHVIFKASSNVSDLLHLKKVIKAYDGERGFNKDCHGKSAPHEYVKVPLGTIVRNRQGVIIADLSQEGAMFLAARGGAGGRGNHFFISDTLQAPEVAEFGAEGEKCSYLLEVKCMAHIGLIGMPNAGKSSLLRAISRARPKVAAYEFTTMKPHIGIVQYNDYEQIAVADLPGLIEGSHENKGLGIEFLKHAERCSGLLFVIDLSREDPYRQYSVLRYEIEKFSEELNRRPFAIVGNKIDLVEAQKNLNEFQRKIKQPVTVISSKTGENLSQLLSQIRVMYDNYLNSSQCDLNTS